MTYFRDNSSSETTDEQYVSFGEELSISNLGQRELLLTMMESGSSLRTMARGFSMWPFIRDKDILTIAPFKNKQPARGDVVAFTQPASGKLTIHRIIGQTDNGLIIKGDKCLVPDGEVPNREIIGYVCRIERNGSDANLGIGGSRAIIALLSRLNILMTGKQLLLFLRKIANRVLPILHSLNFYRQIGKKPFPHTDISDASEDDKDGKY